MVKQIQAIIILCFLLLVPAVVAESYPQGSEIGLKVPVRVDGYISTGVTCNITVLYPNSSILIDFKEMSDKISYFNYTLNTSQTTIKGDYTYCVTCHSSTTGSNQTECFDFAINLGGVDATQSRTDATSRAVYFMFGVAIILFIGLIFSKTTPVKFTFGLGALMFFLIAVNLIFMSMQDEIVNPKVEGFFSSFTAISYIAYWFIGALIGIIWLLTSVVSLMNYMQIKKQRKYGG